MAVKDVDEESDFDKKKDGEINDSKRAKMSMNK